MNDNISKSAFAALILCALLLGGWELYWRADGYFPDIEDTDALYAVQFRRLHKLSDKDIVLLGASRVHFDINLNVWEDITGKRPVQLAGDGKTVAPFLAELVNETDFSGTLIIGVTPGLFFSAPDSSFGWKRSANTIKYIHKETYAQKLDHYVDLMVQPGFAFLNPNELKPHELMERWPIPERKNGPRPFLYFPNFGDNHIDRFKSMYKRVETDSAFRNAIIHVWTQFPMKNKYDHIRDTVINNYVSLVKNFKDRGGRVIFVRCPSTGAYIEAETEFWPRKNYWEVLLKKTGCKGFHFQDYDELKDFDCPEISHLSASDAKLFTARLLEIIQPELNN
jgi:hypothetical protein